MRPVVAPRHFLNAPETHPLPGNVATTGDAFSPVRISPISNAMYGDGVFGLVEEHAVVTNAKAEQSFELA
jgi:hypothetical protein